MRANYIMFYIALTLSSCSSTPLLAQGAGVELVNFERLANAIYKAEGTTSKHPYGILAKYKHTTPRQACINTIRHRYRDWLRTTRKTPYIAYLGHTYCPVGALNDPFGLNRNWVSNVTKFYNRG